ncbi:C2 family cysteine protease [Candidatus Methylobacter favarea]|nr:C2 family cysteine protease [Candidatus Methylobacter favarea]
MDDRFRIPGPVGVTPQSTYARPPGALGFAGGIFAAPGGISQVKALKVLKMPTPAHDNSTRNAHEITFDLYGKGGPAIKDIKQGSLANCPIASILAALAHTPIGRKRIESMIAEHLIPTTTDLSGVAGFLDSPPKGNKIISKRYFTVTLGEKSIDVSDVLYTDDADRNWSLLYMKSPTDSLWPCVIEKAYAVMEGDSYDNLDKEELSANKVFKVLVGSEPDAFSVDDTTDPGKISKALANAGKTPTIAASRDEATGVTGWHGFAVLNLNDSKIELYDPAKAKTLHISLKQFRRDFKAILYKR